VLVLTRLLSPETFGFFALANFWVGLLNLRNKAGLSYAAVRQSQTDGNLLGTYFALDVASAIGSTLIGAITALILYRGGYYKPEVVLALLVLLGAEQITSLVGPLSIALEKEMQLSRMMLVTLASSLMSYSAAIALALRGAGLWSLLLINPLAYTVGLGGTYWVCRRRLPHVLGLRWQFDKPLAMQLLHQGLVTGLSLATLGAIVSQFDNFLIGTFVSPTTLGFYDRAFRIASWPSLLLTTIIARVGFLTMSKVKDDPPRLTHTVRLSLWVLTTLGIPLVLAVLFAANEVVRVLYGQKWSESAFYLRFLIVSNMCGNFTTVAFWLSVALGHKRITALLTAIQAVALIVIATPLTLALGSIGTVIGVCMTMGIGLIFGCVYIFRQTTLTFSETFAPPLLAGTIAILALIALTGSSLLNGLTPLFRLLFIGTVDASVFLGSLFLMRRTEMLERIQYLRRTWQKTQGTA